MNKTAKKTISFLRSNKNKIKLRAIFFMLFLLGLNTYAWFMFITKVNNNIRADVVGWDVKFVEDQTTLENNVSVQIPNMYPGMDDFSQKYQLKNNTKLSVEFDYVISSFNLLGQDYSIANGDFEADEILEMFENGFPFEVTLTNKNDVIGPHENLDFYINVVWDYEADDDYVQINKFYEYYPYAKYYTFDGTNYVEAEVDDTNYDTLLSSGLYMTGDGADSYWGERTYLYKNGDDTKIPLIIEVTLKASQRN